MAFGRILAIGGAILGGLFLFGGSASAAADEPGDKPDDKPDETPPVDDAPKDTPPFTYDPAREQAECKAVADEKPQSYGGRSKGPAQSQFRWLGWVAYRKAYPDGPLDPSGGDWEAALVRITGCVQVRLGQGDIIVTPPPQDNIPPALPPVSDTPKPNSYYRVKFQDTPFGVTKAAYGTTGGKNVAAFKKVNNHERNTKFWVEAPAGEKQWFDMRISFLPSFPSFEEQLKLNGVAAAVGKGNQYPVIWLPPAAEVTG